jgi:hypothetical protein
LVNEITEITELIIENWGCACYGATGHLPVGVNPTIATWLVGLPRRWTTPRDPWRAHTTVR